MDDDFLTGRLVSEQSYDYLSEVEVENLALLRFNYACGGGQDSNWPYNFGYGGVGSRVG